MCCDVGHIDISLPKLARFIALSRRMSPLAEGCRGLWLLTPMVEAGFSVLGLGLAYIRVDTVQDHVYAASTHSGGS